MVGAVMALTGPALAQNLESGDDGFGKQFIRDHEFTVNGLLNEPVSDYVGPNASFSDEGLNTMMAWRVRLQDNIEYANDHGLNWLVEEKPITDLQVEKVNNLAQVPNGLGFVVGDEPSRTGQDNMQRLGDKITELRGVQPDYLYMTNAFPNYATPNQLYGEGGQRPSGYRYRAYLEDINDIVDPDVFMYDNYPFRDGTRRRNGYFANLMIVRDVAQEHNKPYWQMVQGYENDARSIRAPSESDLRMQAFSSLTAGYKGLSYYFYNPPSDSATGQVKLDANNEPVPSTTYTRNKDQLDEVKNLGKALRYLESTAVRFVPGQHNGNTHNAPQGLNDFSRGAGGDPHIDSITVGESDPAKDGLIGTFTGDDGEHYFMLTNLYQNGDLTADAATVDFEIEFDAGEVDEILRLSRETGEQETLTVDNDTLRVVLPGGTGDLFKYNTGDFVTHMPEPTSLALFGLGGVLLLPRRGKRDSLYRHSREGGNPAG